MNGAAAVDEYMSTLEHPFAAEVARLRVVVREAHPLVQERIKWKSPSFHVGGTDLGAFELRPTEFLRLILVFPHGLVDDPTGLMLGSWADRRKARPYNLFYADTEADVHARLTAWEATQGPN